MNSTNAMLDQAAVAQYWRDGYLFPRRVMSPQEAADWRARFNELGEIAASTDLPEPFENYCRANLNVVSTAAAELAQHPGIVDLVSSVIGPNVICWMVELIVKEPHTDKILSVHQDLTYWGFDSADSSVTAWLALSPVADENGAMHFVTGSHRLGAVEHRDTFGQNNLLSRGQEVSVPFDPNDEVVVALEPGEVSLHHGLMFHGSGPNATDQARVGLVIRYVSPAVAQVVGRTDYGMVVRGTNTTGNFEPIAAPASDFDLAALQLFEQISAVQSAPLQAGAAQPMSYTRALE